MHFNKYLTLLVSLFFLSFVACSGASSENAATAISKAQAESKNSEYYTQVVRSTAGDFAGLKIQDSKAQVKEKLPPEALSKESDKYLYYSWEIDNHVYNLDLFFDNNNKLNSIDGYMRFFDSKGAYDPAEAMKLYKDLKEDFTKKYGEEEETSLDGFTYIRWIFESKDIEVGIDNAEVYWYIYSHYVDD